MPSLTFAHLTFAWPDGCAVFRDLTFALAPGLSGIVGRNGIGKTTLARLAAGDLVPGSGAVTRSDRFAYVPQNITLAVDEAVADVLGIGPTVRALRAIEAGSTNPVDYDAVGDDWLVEDRARAVLTSLGLGEIELDRRVGQVSGGEATMLAVGAALLAAPDVLLLDEPTNNLDADARELLVSALCGRPGATAVITHDRTLLGHVERIGELRERPDRTTELRWFGGALAAFEEAAAAEQEGARQMVAAAAAQAARERRDLIARVESAGKRQRQGASARANGKLTRAGVKVKTTLIETLLGLCPPERGSAELRVPAGYLPQRLDVLEDSLSVIDNVQRRAPGAVPQEVRNQLGQFQFRGAAAEALAGTLSGGERFRAALACVLLARPAPQLLVLDEPTNNLDFASQGQLAQALEGFGGALIVVSHDPAFVDAIAPTRRWTLGTGLRDTQLV